MKIIAEIGQGFEGNKELAKVLTRSAAKAGATLVKFQLVFADDLCVPDYEYYDLFKSLELSLEDWKEIKKVTEESGANLLVDVFGPLSVDFAKQIGVKSIKFHPTDINNFELLEQINGIELDEFILGVGGASIKEIRLFLSKFDMKTKLVLMHGYQGYPTPNEDNQLSRIQYIKNYFKEDYPEVQYGFADHVVSDVNYSVVLNSMALSQGASYFEKHMSFGTCVELEDFESSIQPDEFKFFVESLNNAQEAFGATAQKDFFGMSKAEQGYRSYVRRNWLADRNISKGETLTHDNICFKRTSQESEVGLIDLLGKEVKTDIKKNQILQKQDISI